jgi:hypothetical protein
MTERVRQSLRPEIRHAQLHQLRHPADQTDLEFGTGGQHFPPVSGISTRSGARRPRAAGSGTS